MRGTNVNVRPQPLTRFLAALETTLSHKGRGEEVRHSIEDTSVNVLILMALGWSLRARRHGKNIAPQREFAEGWHSIRRKLIIRLEGIRQ